MLSVDEEEDPENRKLIAAGNQGGNYFLRLMPEKFDRTSELSKGIVRRHGKPYRISTSLQS